MCTAMILIGNYTCYMLCTRGLIRQTRVQFFINTSRIHVISYTNLPPREDTRELILFTHLLEASH